MTDTTNYLIVSAICGVLMALIKVLYDSKCVHIRCCGGFVDIERDVRTEFQEDEHKHQEQNKQ